MFEKVRLNTQEVLRAVNTEGSLWCMTGASKLQELVLSVWSPLPDSGAA